MLRIVVSVCSLVCLVVAAPTVHLLQPEADQYGQNTEQPLIIEPVAVTMKPLVETTYVDPVNWNYQQAIETAIRQPAERQPTLFYPPTYMHHYNGYQQQPLYGQQWPWPQSALPQQPIMQPSSTNVLPCSQNRHIGGYQQHGY